LVVGLPDAVQIRMAIRRARRPVGGGLLAGNRHDERNRNGANSRCSESNRATNSQFHRLIPLQARTIRHIETLSRIEGSKGSRGSTGSTGSGFLRFGFNLPNLEPVEPIEPLEPFEPLTDSTIPQSFP